MNAFGTGALLLGVLCLVKLFQGRMRGWWSYAGKPLLIWVCAQTLTFSAILMGNARLSHEGEVAAMFFIVMPAVLLLVLLFVRGRPAGVGASATGMTGVDAARAAVAPLPPLPPLPGQPAGARRAARMRRRAQWHEAQAWRVKGPPLHVRLFNFVKGLVVGTSLTTLLLIATAAWLFIAMNIPGMLAAGVPDKDLPRDLTEKFGFEQWPQMMLSVGYAVGWGALLLAAAVLVVARRSTYGLHIVRGLVGVAVFAASLVFLDRALHGNWKVIVAAGPGDGVSSAAVTSSGVLLHNGEDGLDVAVGPEGVHMSQSPRRPRDPNAERVATAFERYLGSAATSAVPVAGGIALVGLVLMCWPARKDRSEDAVLPPLGGPEVPAAPQNA
jgi:hypothetical protein